MINYSFVQKIHSYNFKCKTLYAPQPLWTAGKLIQFFLLIIDILMTLNQKRVALAVSMGMHLGVNFYEIST